MNRIDPVKCVDIIGVPSDLGSSVVGSNEGPFAIRNCGLFSSLSFIAEDVRDLGNISVPLREELYGLIKDSHPHLLGKIPYSHDHMGSVHAPSFALIQKHLQQMFSTLASTVESSMESDRFPLILGGDHSLSIGSLRGISSAMKKRKRKLGVIWFDAHIDGHDSLSSISGNLHGMALGALLSGDQTLGEASVCDPKDVVIIGARSVDRGERERAFQLGVRVHGLDRFASPVGMHEVMMDLEKNFFANVDEVHVSFDLDVCDPGWLSGVSTPVAAGLSQREVYMLLRAVASSKKLCSFELVELNPRFDKDRRSAQMACSMILWALGGGA